MEVGFKNKVPCMVKFWTLFLIRSWGLLAMPMSEGVSNSYGVCFTRILFPFMRAPSS